MKRKLGLRWHTMDCILLGAGLNDLRGYGPGGMFCCTGCLKEGRGKQRGPSTTSGLGLMLWNCQTVTLAGNGGRYGAGAKVESFLNSLLEVLEYSHDWPAWLGVRSKGFGYARSMGSLDKRAEVDTETMRVLQYQCHRQCCLLLEEVKPECKRCMSSLEHETACLSIGHGCTGDYGNRRLGHSLSARWLLVCHYKYSINIRGIYVFPPVRLPF